LLKAKEIKVKVKFIIKLKHPIWNRGGGGGVRWGIPNHKVRGMASLQTEF
jgi:hypothetical protein